MGRKKNKIAKITEEQYYAYIAGLRKTPRCSARTAKRLSPPPSSAKRTTKDRATET